MGYIPMHADPETYDYLVRCWQHEELKGLYRIWQDMEFSDDSDKLSPEEYKQFTTHMNLLKHKLHNFYMNYENCLAEYEKNIYDQINEMENPKTEVIPGLAFYLTPDSTDIKMRQQYEQTKLRLENYIAHIDH